MNKLPIIILLITYCWSTGIASGQLLDTRKPVPSIDEIKPVLSTVRELYKDQYDRGAAGYSKLGRELLSASKSTRISTEQYVLLRESIRLSAEVGDIGLATNGLRNLLDEFRVADPYQSRMDFVKELAKKIPDEFAGHQLLRFGYEGYEQAIREDRFEMAGDQLKQLQGLARKGKFIHWADLFKHSKRKLKKIEEAYEGVASSFAELRSNPDSANANFQVASYVLKAKDDIELAMPYFAKGPSGELRSLAKRYQNLVDATPLAERIELADDLEQLGNKTSTFSPLELALGEYMKSAKKATGLEQKRMESRISELEQQLTSQTHITEFFGRKWNVKWEKGHAPWMNCHFLSSRPENVATVNGKPRNLAYKFQNGVIIMKGPVSPFVFTSTRGFGKASFEKIVIKTGKTIDEYRER